MGNKDYGYYIAMIGVAIIIIWAILKSIGIIQSPVYLEMIPYIGIAVTFGGLVVTVRNLEGDVKDFKTEIKSEFKEVRVEIKEVRDKVFHLDKEVELIKSKI